MHLRSAHAPLPRRSPRRWARLATLLAAGALALTLAFAAAQATTDAATETPVRVYYFWGDGCPVCEQQKGFLEWLEERHPSIEVHAFEVWFVRAHVPLLEAFSAAFDQPVRGVPVTFIGDHAWVGFSQIAATQMTAAVDAYALLETPPDAGARVESELLARFVSEAP
jgi:thiol-disulfide isomerase/thioredoxin